MNYFKTFSFILISAALAISILRHNTWLAFPWAVGLLFFSLWIIEGFRKPEKKAKRKVRRYS